MTLEQRIQHTISKHKPSLELLPGAAIIHDLRTLAVVYMSALGMKSLKITAEQLQEMGPDYHKQFFNPDESNDYVPKLYELLERNNPEEFFSFFQQVRTSRSSDWEWWLSSIRILMQNDEGKPLLTLTMSIPVDPEHNIATKVERLLQENNFLRKNGELFASLTKRERQILGLMAQDKTSADMAAQLYVAEDTVKTHRRNIKKKINAQNQYDIIRFAQAFDII